MRQLGYGEYIVQAVESLPYEAVIQTGDIALRLAKQFALPYAGHTARIGKTAAVARCSADVLATAIEAGQSV